MSPCFLNFIINGKKKMSLRIFLVSISHFGYYGGNIGS